MSLVLKANLFTAAVVRSTFPRFFLLFHFYFTPLLFRASNYFYQTSNVTNEAVFPPDFSAILTWMKIPSKALAMGSRRLLTMKRGRFFCSVFLDHTLSILSLCESRGIKQFYFHQSVQLNLLLHANVSCIESMLDFFSTSARFLCVRIGFFALIQRRRTGSNWSETFE